MAADIYIKPGEISSSLLKKAEDHLETAQSKLKTFNSTPVYLGPNGYTSLYTYSITSEISRLSSEINTVAGKLEKYAAILNSGPDALAEIDRNYKNELTTWWDRTMYSISETGVYSVISWSDGIQSDNAYAGVNAYLGKVEAKAESDFFTWKTKSKTEYKDGKWDDDEATSTYVFAEVGAGVSATLLSADAECGIGDDMLGLEGDMELNIGNAKAEAEGEFSVNEKGVNLYAKGEAMVSAVEGEATGTINILGFEIKVTAGGYAGAIGVEGEIGIKDGTFKMHGGGAALVGFSLGVEIGINDESLDNFVDVVTFWD